MRLLVVLVLLIAPSLAHAQAALTEDAVLHGGYPIATDSRGISVASSSDGARVIVGAIHGGARIFEHGASGWVLDHEVRPDTPRAEAEMTVAISGDGNMVLIGEPSDRAGGVVSVLVRREGVWTREAELRVSDAARGDRFGAAIALAADGSRALIGVPGDDTSENDAGSARVFSRQAGHWLEEATLVAADGARRDGLGASVALSSDGSIALVGAPRDDLDDAEDAGSVHAFALTIEGWQAEGIVRAGGLARRDLFGSTIALSGDGRLAMVGAPGEDVGDVRDVGSVRVLSRADGAWRLEAMLTPDALMRATGTALALSADGGVALVAGRLDRQTVVRVLTRNASGWSIAGGTPVLDAGRGPSLALSWNGAHAVIGAPGDAIDDVPRSGSARAYQLRADAAWAATAEEVVGPRHPGGVLTGRTPEQEQQIADASLGCVVTGTVLGAVGLVTLVVGLVLGVGDAFSGSSSSSNSSGVWIAGASILGVGVLALAAGGLVYSQASHGGLRPQLVLAPTPGGAYAGLTLRF